MPTVDDVFEIALAEGTSFADVATVTGAIDVVSTLSVLAALPGFDGSRHDDVLGTVADVLSDGEHSKRAFSRFHPQFGRSGFDMRALLPRDGGPGQRRFWPGADEVAFDGRDPLDLGMLNGICSWAREAVRDYDPDLYRETFGQVRLAYARTQSPLIFAIEIHSAAVLAGGTTFLLRACLRSLIGIRSDWRNFRHAAKSSDSRASAEAELTVAVEELATSIRTRLSDGDLEPQAAAEALLGATAALRTLIGSGIVADIRPLDVSDGSESS